LVPQHLASQSRHGHLNCSGTAADGQQKLVGPPAQPGGHSRHESPWHCSWSSVNWMLTLVPGACLMPLCHPLNVPGAGQAARFIEPMLLPRTDKLSERTDWQYEVNDGYRTLTINTSGSISGAAMTRTSKGAIPAWPGALASLPHETVIDGEVAAFDSGGKQVFSLLQNSGGPPLSGSGRVCPQDIAVRRPLKCPYRTEGKTPWSQIAYVSPLGATARKSGRANVVTPSPP
jgi:hypothetical protein